MRITATHLEQWADTREAQGMLPIIIRRLVSVTAETKALSIPGGDSVGEPGWDGCASIARGNAWVPTGEVRWEMGCSANVTKKARDDLQKRTLETDASIANGISFVFVSPRRWRRKNAWQEEANKLGAWREVRAYDADDLEAWIETAPSVALWLGEVLGLSGHGIESLERYWENWRHQTRYPLTKATIFTGREAVKEALSQALSKSPRLIAIQADSREEAVAFACAQMLENGEADRAACVITPDGWRFADANTQLAIGLAASPEVAVQRAPKDGFTLIVPLSTGDKAAYFSGAPASATEAQHHIVLERPRFQQFESALCDLGEEASDAARLARATGRSWSAYRRMRAQNPAIQRPAWMSAPGARALSVVALIGGWDRKRQGDRSCLESICERPYDDLEADLRSIARMDDAPVLQIGSVWKAKAPRELLYLFGPEITAGELQRFFAVANAVLGQPDPALELEEKDRWAAAVYGKVREESGLVIEAIADSLAKLRVYAENSADPNAVTIMVGVDAVVRTLLHQADEERWLSLAGILRELAEASPDEFLNQVEDSLDRADAPIRRLLSETGQAGSLGRCWHATLLWALEILAWYPARLARVTTILAELMSTPIAGNWVNTPLNTLSTLFSTWWPQTTATATDRLSVIDRLFKTHPEPAWSLLYALVPASGGSATANARPNWRDDDAGAKAPLSSADMGLYLSGIGERLIKHAHGSPERIAQLIEILGRFDGDFRDDILQLVQRSTAFDDEGRELIRTGVRRRLRWESRSKKQRDSRADDEVARLSRAYDALAARDIVKRHKWLFASSWVELSSEDSDTDDRDQLPSVRADAVRDIFNERGWSGMTELTQQSGDPFVVGWTIATANLPEKALSKWATERYEASGCQANLPLVSGILHAISPGSRTQLLHDFASHFSSDKSFASLLTCAPCDRTSWDFVEQATNEAQEIYWRSTRPGFMNRDSVDLEYFLDHLVAANRPRTAFQSISHQLECVAPRRLLDLLDRIRQGTEPDGPLPDGWHIREAIELSEKSDQVTRRELAMLEFSYYKAFGHSDELPKNLYAEFLSDPTLFVDCICLVYRPRNSTQEPNDESLRVVAESAWSLLHNGRGVPGIQDDDDIDPIVFLQWVNTVRKLAGEMDRAEVTEVTVGQWLSVCPADPDETWPHLIVRDLLEESDSDRLRRGFVTGVLNNRGIVSRDCYEGGEQERTLAAKYRGYAARIRVSYPRVATMLEDIARSYEHDAQRVDIEAKLHIEGD